MKVDTGKSMIHDSKNTLSSLLKIQQSLRYLASILWFICHQGIVSLVIQICRKPIAMLLLVQCFCTIGVPYDRFYTDLAVIEVYVDY